MRNAETKVKRTAKQIAARVSDTAKKVERAIERPFKGATA